MKKIFFVLFAFLLLQLSCAISFAQPVFNNCNLHPAFGDSLIGYAQQYDATNVTSGSSSSAITWNFSGLTSLNDSLPLAHYYFNPSVAPGDTMYPSAAVADSTTDGYFSYYQHSPDSTSYLGKYNAWYDFYYNWNPEKQMICPLNFSNSFSDFYSWYNTGTVCSIYHAYTDRIISYDAYGTLILSNATYSNVARLKVIENTTDTILCPPNKLITISEDTTYYWIDMNSNQPVMMWQYSNNISDTIVSKGIQTYSYSHIPVSVSTGTNDLPASSFDLQVYPNPTNGTTNVLISGLNNVQMNIYDVFGKCIYQHISTSAHQQIDLSSQPNGIYFLQIKTAKEMLEKKIAIQH